jgi:uncharacterized protein (TIGR03083 family)
MGMDETRWAEVERERRSLADLLDGLTPEQWENGSLCTRWRVKDVAAHVAMTPIPAPGVLTLTAELVRSGGKLWDAGAQIAINHARRPSAQIVDELRRYAGSRRMPTFVNPENLILDLLVHGQDIAVPLDIDRPIPLEAGQAAFARAWSMGWPFHARRRLRGLRLVATDAPVDVGDQTGAWIEGRLADLLLLVTARTEAGLGRLRGAGTSQLQARTRPLGGTS